MPELPEVETVRQSLIPHLVGAQIQIVTVHRASVIASPGVTEFKVHLQGRSFSPITVRRGKYLLWALDQGWLGVHLRMTGRLIWATVPSVHQAHLRVNFALSNGTYLEFHDPRAFGRLWYIPPQIPPEHVIRALAKLGPEPEDVTVDHLQKSWARKSIPVKVALLDQTIIAGLGNIYADESLFTARILPTTPARNLDPGQLTRLVTSLQQVIRSAIQGRGTTLRDYSDGTGSKGGYQQCLRVYGRYGQACYICGTLIMRLRLGGRSSHYCPVCQNLDAVEEPIAVKVTPQS